jgi:hypothetical protein
MMEAAYMVDSLPPMVLRKQVPRLSGQDTSDFKWLSAKAQFAGRAWLIKVEDSKAPMLRLLVEKAKQYGCVSNFWGKHAHITEVASYDTMGSKLKCLGKTVN